MCMIGLFMLKSIVERSMGLHVHEFIMWRLCYRNFHWNTPYAYLVVITLADAGVLDFGVECTCTEFLIAWLCVLFWPHVYLYINGRGYMTTSFDNRQPSGGIPLVLRAMGLHTCRMYCAGNSQRDVKSQWLRLFHERSHPGKIGVHWVLAASGAVRLLKHHMCKHVYACSAISHTDDTLKCGTLYIV